ncbi:cytochrome P450 [Yinghuangia sp. ASG 101]|uniref:cytochrome P450 family protein n=1 Tax=Yinghuangia sp. ASG 101 TaxID=2896848 RepID=UPI001E31CFD4|nr:cytochrome P450 [Yinghuangia sp. ASG 101]UGQ11813.1 cytochrome P450 [Yinghuangia sp. ASG 101]
MADPAFLRDPYPVYAALRRDHPVRRTPHGVWYVSRHADVEAALADLRLSNDRDRMTSALFARDGGLRALSRLTERLGRVMTNTDPPAHARLRGLVNKAFTARRVEQLRDRVQEITDRLLDAMVARGRRADFVADVAEQLPVTVVCELFGIPAADRDRVAAWFHRLGDITGDIDRAEAAVIAFEDYLGGLIRDRRGGDGVDIISALTAAQARGDRLTDDELLSTCFMVVTAGDQTTTHLIGNGLLALLRHPDQLALLREDPGIIPAAVDELARYDTPTQAIIRVVAEDTPFAGHTLPAGDLVYLLLGSANHDPDHVPDPDRLDLTRVRPPGARPLTFGHGPHFCLGAPLARLQAQTAIATAVRRLPDLRLAVGDDELAWHANPLQRRLRALPIRY